MKLGTVAGILVIFASSFSLFFIISNLAGVNQKISTQGYVDDESGNFLSYSVF
jgi:hypothetical protein